MMVAEKAAGRVRQLREVLHELVYTPGNMEKGKLSGKIRLACYQLEISRLDLLEAVKGDARFAQEEGELARLKGIRKELDDAYFRAWEGVNFVNLSDEFVTKTKALVEQSEALDFPIARARSAWITAVEKVFDLGPEAAEKAVGRLLGVTS